MVIAQNLDLYQKLEILSDAAKYDVACTSSGVDRKGSGAGMGNCMAPGICHTFSADGRCISLLKILMTNECVYDCKYCINRCSNDTVRASFTPEEICTLTMEFYRRNYIEGLFLSSGVWKNPNHTMLQMLKALRLLRSSYGFEGYIHVKVIPGAQEALIEEIGFLADRVSVNLELPTAEGLKQLAPHKTRNTILRPMRQIQMQRREDKKMLTDGISKDGGLLTSRGFLPDCRIQEKKSGKLQVRHTGTLFAPAGQSTQMIIGATPEADYQILSVAEALYRKFELKRVFYSAFIRVNDDPLLPVLAGGPPLKREHRLYQADWLLRYYGFEASELLSEAHPNFNALLDPKCDWALSHLEAFPVEVNRADYQKLLRVPGIGPKSAKRIIAARRMGALDFADLKKAGVVLKRAVYFITCKGRQMYPLKIEEDFILRNLLSAQSGGKSGPAETVTYRQLSLFDTGMEADADRFLTDMGGRAVSVQ